MAGLNGESTTAPAALSHLPPETRVRHVDLLATLLSLLGLDAAPEHDGLDLTDPLSPLPEAAYFESLAAYLHFQWAQITGVRTREGVHLRDGDPGLSISGVSGAFPPLPGTASPDSTPERAKLADAHHERLALLELDRLTL